MAYLSSLMNSRISCSSLSSIIRSLEAKGGNKREMDQREDWVSDRSENRPIKDQSYDIQYGCFSSVIMVENVCILYITSKEMKKVSFTKIYLAWVTCEETHR